MTHRDRAVQRTDDDAAQSKLSAVKRGYYSDNHIQLFTRDAAPRLPLINIGTYCRVLAIDTLIDKFLEQCAGSRCQIVSLGAGSDTRPFNVLPRHKNLTWYELDFAVKTAQKKRIVLENGLLGAEKESEPEPASTSTPTSLSLPNYHLIGMDLRDLTDLTILDRETPTLVLSECCLCYINPSDSSKILKYFTSLISDISFALYEPISLQDEFGRVMMENLAHRGISLPSFQQFYSTQTQALRLSSLGLDAGACDILEVYRTWLTKEDRARIASLEFLDEVEEMNLLLRHYCIVWGRRE